MPRKSGKNITAARAKIEPRPYKMSEAADAIKSAHYAKFDETVELVLNLGVDPKHSDQMVRGTVVLPNGLGKSKRVLVIASGEKVREAQEAGADFVGGEDMVEKVQEGWTDYDADESDLADFAADFGRTNCDSGTDCKGDFDADGDDDGSDLSVFASLNVVEFYLSACNNLIILFLNIIDRIVFS